VLWDVIDEHLAEAAFGLAQFERSLDHPTRTLQELEPYPERTTIAHIHALALGGSAVFERVLSPVLKGEEDPEPSRMMAAALALLHAGVFEPIWAGFAHESPLVRGALVRAAALSCKYELERGLMARLELQQPPAARAALLELVALRALPPPNLFEALQNEDDRVLAAAARAAMSGEPKVLLPIVESLLEHPALSVREAALVTALAWNSHKAWVLVQKLAYDPNPLRVFAMQLTAALGGRSHHRQILELAREPELKQACLSALALSGNADVLPALLEQIAGKDAPAAKLAAQAFAAITGLDLREESFSSPDPDPDPDPDRAPIPEEALHSPNAEAIAAWLRANHPNLDASKRLLHGTPLTLAGLIDALENAPLRRRHGLALMLCLRTHAALRIDTRLFSAVQRNRIASVRALAANTALRSFANW
jgi:uncharacterized protein (TIGR02270 family)